MLEMDTKISTWILGAASKTSDGKTRLRFVEHPISSDLPIHVNGLNNVPVQRN